MGKSTISMAIFNSWLDNIINILRNFRVFVQVSAWRDFRLAM